MASYKVPQDVEADDKLIGPFSFRQFIYLIIVALAIALAWGLAQLFIGLAIIPLPIILLFGALALPLRKDQPMEIYLAAIVSFYLKPRVRKWDPDGVETTVTISAPKTVEVQRTKGFGSTEAEQRLRYLADIVDTQGWAIRGLDGSNTPLNNDMYVEAQGATDILDTNTSIARNFDTMMAVSSERAKEEARQRMFNPVESNTLQPNTAPQENLLNRQEFGTQTTQQLPETPPSPLVQQIEQHQMSQQPLSPGAVYSPVQESAHLNQPIESTPRFDPYPEFHQSVLQPLDTRHHADNDTSHEHTQGNQPRAIDASPPIQNQAPGSAAPLSTSDNDLKAGIINLANNPDLSIETIAHEAERLKKRAEKEKEDNGDVIVSLR